MNRWDDKDYTGGWRIDLEDRDKLVATSSAMPSVPGAYRSAPPVEKPWELVVIQHQKSQGACQGHALSTICELCHGIATHTKPFVQLSRQYAYIETQRLDGLLGADRGSTINGGVRLAKSKGICEESLWEYPGRYQVSPPNHTIAECYENAEQYRIKQHVVMNSYRDIYDFIDMGTGGVSIGIRWNSSCNRAVCEKYSRRGGGGHAISLLCKSPRVDSSGRNYIWMVNSWGDWMNHGCSEWSPSFIDQLFQDRYTVAVGLTDMEAIKPRVVDYGGLI